MTPDERRHHLIVLAEHAASCTRCGLHRKRGRPVFSRGPFIDPEIAFVGEGPGQTEDETGVPFVGPAGQLLDRMIEAMGYRREAVYVCNVVKCRPPGNRTPSDVERITCSTAFLAPQLALVRPRVVVALGRTAATALGIVGMRWRGTWSAWQGIPVLATYHPAYLLRDASQKAVVWADLKLVLERLGRPVP